MCKNFVPFPSFKFFQNSSRIIMVTLLLYGGSPKKRPVYQSFIISQSSCLTQSKRHESPTSNLLWQFSLPDDGTGTDRNPHGVI